MAKAKIRGDEEHAGWKDMLLFLDRQLLMCEHNITNYDPCLHDRSRTFYRGSLAASQIARDAVLKEVRKYQEGRDATGA